MLLRLALASVLVTALCVPALALPSADAPEIRPEEEAAILNSAPVIMTQPVRVRSGMLSVDVSYMAFGRLMEEIGRQAGFEVHIGPEVAQKELTTSFRDMELIKGIQRLFTLISQRNYFIHYGADDTITRIEVYDSSQLSSPTVKPRERTPTTSPSKQGVRQIPARTLPMVAPIGSPGTDQRRPARTKPSVTRQIPKTPSGSDSGTPVVPYVVPSGEPQFIPPFRSPEEPSSAEEEK